MADLAPATAAAAADASPAAKKPKVTRPASKPTHLPTATLVNDAMKDECDDIPRTIENDDGRDELVCAHVVSEILLMDFFLNCLP